MNLRRWPPPVSVSVFLCVCVCVCVYVMNIDQVTTRKNWMSVTWQLCTFYSCFGLKPVWTLFFTSTFHFAAVWLLFSTMTDIDHSKYKRKVINPSHIYSAKREKCEKLFDLNHHVLTLSQFLFNLNFLGETFSLAKRANARLSCPTNESRVRAPSIGRIYHCLWIIQSNENILRILICICFRVHSFRESQLKSSHQKNVTDF